MRLLFVSLGGMRAWGVGLGLPGLGFWDLGFGVRCFGVFGRVRSLLKMVRIFWETSNLKPNVMVRLYKTML